MKAYVLRSFGPPDHLVLTDVDTPVPGADEVLVRVRATSVNPWDWHQMRGQPYIVRPMNGVLRHPKLSILGCDMAGRVEAVGTEVTGFRPGDDVFALLERGGGFGEYVAVPERLLVRKPANLSYEQAAAVPMAGLTALFGLRDVGRVAAGQRVLVNGGSGGVGTFTVQIAKALGASTDAVCGPHNADLVRSIGADEVIDYTRQDFTRTGRRYDMLADIAGSRSARSCRRVVKRDGTLVLIGGPAGRWVQPAGHVFSSLAMAPLVPHRVALAAIESCAEKKRLLGDLAALIEDGKVTPVITRQYGFGEMHEAVAYQEQGHVPGKIVVEV